MRCRELNGSKRLRAWTLAAPLRRIESNEGRRCEPAVEPLDTSGSRTARAVPSPLGPVALRAVSSAESRCQSRGGSWPRGGCRDRILGGRRHGGTGGCKTDTIVDSQRFQEAYGLLGSRMQATGLLPGKRGDREAFGLRYGTHTGFRDARKRVWRPA